MKLLTSISFSLAALLPLAYAAPAPTDSVPAVPVVDPGAMTITGSIFPGGPELNLTGTLEELIPKIKELYPDWDPVADTSPAAKRSIEARYFQGRPTCWQPGEWDADRSTIRFDGVPYLQGLGNAAYVPSPNCHYRKLS
ncbi:hypothetical protein TWF281_011018 [Arthrobotrys megalospora]